MGEGRGLPKSHAASRGGGGGHPEKGHIIYEQCRPYIYFEKNIQLRKLLFKTSFDHDFVEKCTQIFDCPVCPDNN